MKGIYRIRKALAVGCVALMGTGLLTGCGSSVSDGNATGTDAAAGTDTAQAGLPDVDSDEVVLVVGDEKITEEEVMVYALLELLSGQVTSSMVQSDESTYKNEVLTEIRETKILYAQALEDNMEFGDDDKEQVDTLIQSFKDYVGADALDEYGISDEMVEKVITETSYVDKLENDTQNQMGKSLTEEYNEKYKDYNFQTVYYMVFPTIEADDDGNPKQDDDGNYIPLDDDAKAEAKTQAESAQAEVASGKDAEEVAEAYGVDSYSDDKAGIAGQYSDTINDAMSELEEGQCTGIYESDTGYYFVTLLSDNDQTMFDSYVYAIVSDDVDEQYATKKQEWMDKVPTDDSTDLLDGIWEKFSLVGVAADLQQKGLMN
jgi:hypothetical protein